MHIIKRLWLFIAIVLLFVYPIIGVLLLIPIFGDKEVGLASFSNNKSLRNWLIVWIPYLLLMLVPLVYHKDWYGIFSYVLQVVFAILLFLLFRSAHKQFPKQFFATAITVALGLLTIAGVAERYLGSRVWLNDDTSFVQVVSSSLQTEQNLSFPNNFYRVWQIAPNTDTIKLAWKAKLLSGTANWDWQSRTQEDNLSVVKGAKSLTHFTPKGKDPFIYKSLHQASSIAGLSVQATIDIRNSSKVENCGILSLADRGATIFKSINICAEETWQTYSLEWRVPDETTKKDLTFVINQFRKPLDIGELQLAIKPAGELAWQTIDTLAPNGISVRLNWQDAWLEELLLEERFIPTEQWQEFSLELQANSLKDAGQLTGVISGERGLSIAVKDLNINSNETIKAIAGQNLRRLKLWFHHPNLMGHATVAIALSGLAFSQATISTILIIVFSVFLIILSGSRAAMLTLAIGIILVLFFKLSKNTLRTKRITLIASLIAIPIVFFVLIMQFDAFSRLAFGVGRMDIWSVAWQAIQQKQLFGIGFGNFSEFFATLRPNRAVVNHAHNLVFVYLSSYGIFGGLAITWLLGAWLFFIIRGRTFTTTSILLIPLACLIFANIFDFSFFNAAVITALIAILPFHHSNPQTQVR